MKQLCLSTAAFFAFIMALVPFSANPLFAQSDDVHHGCVHHNISSKLDIHTPPVWGEIESPQSSDAAPTVEVVFDQQEGGALLYETVAAWTGSQAGKAQISLRIWVKNKQGSNINWNKAVFQYTQNGVLKSKTFNFTLDPITPNNWRAWQNSREYHEVGDVLYLDAPIPANLTVKLYFAGYTDPVT
ncbi:MAG: hypothetical protein IT261_08195, partial [Saprospiraceae bacterium]|nr:hypothetical protein [Saprospiraceae bacterium]